MRIVSPGKTGAVKRASNCAAGGLGRRRTGATYERIERGHAGGSACAAPPGSTGARTQAFVVERHVADRSGQLAWWPRPPILTLPRYGGNGRPLLICCRCAVDRCRRPDRRPARRHGADVVDPPSPHADERHVGRPEMLVAPVDECPIDSRRDVLREIPLLPV